MFRSNCALSLVLVLALVCSVSALSFAESPQAASGASLTLDDCIERAMAGNPTLQAAQQRMDAAQQRVRQARGVPNPRLEVEAENFGGAGEYDAWDGAEITYAITQEIELGGERGARTAEAVAEAAAALAEYESRKLDLLRDAKTAFFMVLLAQEKVRLAEAVVRLAEDIQKTTDARVTAGKGPPLESERVKVESALRRVEHNEALRDLASAQRRLAALWGSAEATFEAVQGTLDEGDLHVPAIAELLARMEGNPDLTRAEALIQASESRLRGERAARVPNMEVAAGLRQFEDTRDSAFMARIALELPLFNFNSGAVRAAAAEVEATRLDKCAAQLALENEIRQLHDRVQTAGNRVMALKESAVPAAERAVAAAQAGYMHGKFGYLEVLDAQKTFHETRLQYLNAIGEFQVGLADLGRLAGPF